MSFQYRVKRIVDILCSGLGLILLSPLLIIIAILIKINLGSPIFFIQDRIGEDGKVFKMIKFRTMINLIDESGEPLEDSERLTLFGKLLRSTSLDELPELIKVLKCDMSLVGPRPLLIRYMKLYSKEQWRRHEVKPGITGWAQVNGRNNISWNDKFKLDVWYVDNKSIILDFKIMFMTVYRVIRRDDINKEGEATVEDFDGNN